MNKHAFIFLCLTGFFGQNTLRAGKVLAQADQEQADLDLHFGVLTTDIEMVKSALTRHANINAEMYSAWIPWTWAGKTPLLHAVDIYDGSGSPARQTNPLLNHEIIELLLQNGADASRKNIICRRTALQLAIDSNKAYALRPLIEKGADFAQKANNGKTALHIASENNDNALVELLLRRATTETQS